MATLKLKKPETPRGIAPGPKRAPVRGTASKSRPTLSQAQTERERAARERPAFDRRGPSGPGSDRRAPPRPDAPRPAVQRPDTRGPDTRSPDTRRPETRGQDTRGPNTRGPDRRGPDARGPAPQRPDTRRPDAQRPAARGPESRPFDAPHAAGPRPTAPRPDGGHPPARPEARAPRRAEAATPVDDTLRLSKRMSQLGIASRREADEWISRGWVRVDGRIVSELGSRVLPEQHITVDPRARNEQARRVTVLLNKPVGYVSGQAEDGHEPAFVLVTPQNQWREDRSGTQFAREHLRSLVPAGRLDIDSVGLLVLTQDGRVARQLVGEDSAIEKEYLVRVVPAEAEALAPNALALLNHGLELDGEALRPARVEWLNEDQLRFVLRQGKKRQIRRMCEAVGLKVTGLKRVRVGALVLGDLPTGQWRYLRADESFGEPVVESADNPESPGATEA